MQVVRFDLPCTCQCDSCKQILPYNTKLKARRDGTLYSVNCPKCKCKLQFKFVGDRFAPCSGVSAFGIQQEDLKVTNASND